MAMVSDSTGRASAADAVRPGRTRAIGRIGGIAGVPETEALDALARARGPGAQVLGPGARVVADWDCCRFRGAPIGDVQGWRAVVACDALDQVAGAFAVAWLSPDGSVALARDAIGERTLYYAELRPGIVFASTMAAVLATGLVERRLDVVAVAAYLSYGYVPGQPTLVAGVRELLPGETVRFRDGALVTRRFWSIPEEPPPAEVNEAEVTARLRSSLEDAVERRLPDAEDVGAFLSGGLDSSLVVALARARYRGRVTAYSIAFGPGHPNELAFSSLVARHCAVDHRVLELSPASVAGGLDATVASLDKPIGDPLTVPNALLFREAARDVGIVLNGEGGDPCFGGPKNLPMLLAELLDVPGEVDPHGRARSYLRAHQKCYAEMPSILTSAARAALAGDVLETPITRHFADARWRGFVTKLMALNVALKGAHHILPKVDALGGAAGVLPRSPLFDRAVVELSFAIPPQLKLRGSVEKHVLKEAVKDLLPAVILDRPKSGMLVPVEAWFEGPLLPVARERILDGLGRGSVFRRPYLEQLLGGRLGGVRPRRGAKIWLLLTLESWLRTFRLTA
jgi:asparagine synthase (glutamine-hydrolysing)